MHTVDLLEEALRAAAALGHRVRQEWLGGGGGSCEIKGRPHIFVDLSLSLPEQLEQALESLRRDARAYQLALSPALRSRLEGGQNAGESGVAAARRRSA